MITKEELDILLNENMISDAFDILVEDCCNIVSEKLEYKKQYKEIYDLKFLLAKLYYLDINFKNVILNIYELIDVIKTDDEDKVYDLYNKTQMLYEQKYSRNIINLSKELKYLVSIGKNEFARKIIEENYYNKIFANTLRRNNILFSEEEKFSDLCKKVGDIKQNYKDKILLIITEEDELKRIDLLLEFSGDFTNRKTIKYDRKYFEHLIDEWLFIKAYKELKKCFIEQFLKMLNDVSDEEDIDKLFNELSVQMYMEKNDISKECLEINKRINSIDTVDEENNIENLNRLLDLYEFIQDK